MKTVEDLKALEAEMYRRFWNRTDNNDHKTNTLMNVAFLDIAEGLEPELIEWCMDNLLVNIYHFYFSLKHTTLEKIGRQAELDGGHQLHVFPSQYH